MAWYDDRNRVSYIGTYKDEKSARSDLELAVKRGWKIEDTTGDGGHINVGRTATGAVLTGGLSLLFGGSRSKRSLTLVFVRDPASIARAGLELGLSNLRTLNDRCLRADADSERAAAEFRTKSVAALATTDLGRERIEKEVREALDEWSKKSSSAAISRKELIEVATAVEAKRDAAAGLGVTVDSPFLAVLAALPNLRAAQSKQIETAGLTAVALTAQRSLERSAHEYQSLARAGDDAKKRLTAAEGKVSQNAAVLEAAAPDKVPTLQKRLDDAQREVAACREKVSTSEAALQIATERLNAELAGRKLALEALVVS